MKSSKKETEVAYKIKYEYELRDIDGCTCKVTPTNTYLEERRFLADLQSFKSADYNIIRAWKETKTEEEYEM